ncbi:prepilin-type N-terminal cleavage/methylation domain-containing protein [uncultured Aliivibrio sp.]|uniref:type II secretion system protein n=1 Tax=uncultured Aliivibrio sp. TaxID=873085 RepID=UPI002619FF87|nr:prepilin-type N-terminal cleavage/methylation domain-containing protein [uncultured Aliivibrio sp.]
MRNKGFTLIELVIVIVVLGILSATAVPKFMNLQDDARLATFKSEGAAIKSGLELVHKKAIIGPITDGKLTINGEFITINPKTMYPIFLEENLEKQIMAFVDIDLSRYDVEYYKTGFMMYPNTFTPENEKYCLIEYAYDKFNIDTTSCFTGL